jgi:hypothetical protein
MAAGAAAGKLPAFDAGHFMLWGVRRIVCNFVDPRPDADVVGLELITDINRHSSSV